MVEVDTSLSASNDAIMEKGIVSMQLKSLIPMLSVANVEKRIAFYQEALAFGVLNRYEHDGRLPWAMVKSGDTELMFAHCDASQGVLIPAKKEDLVLCCYPDNVEALHASLKDKGYRVGDLRVPFYGMQECDLTDPGGYPLSFGQETDEPETIGEVGNR